MKKNFNIEERVTNRVWIYTLDELNAKGEKLTIELTRCENDGNKNSLPNLWKNNGYIDRVLGTYLHIDSCVDDSEGNCWIKYNPQIKPSDDGKRNVINFDWMLEDTEENKEKLINEVYRLFSTATGKTATEEKHDKVREYANSCNIEVVESIPEGGHEDPRMTDPVGAVSIVNMKMSLKNIKSGAFQRKLLLV